MDTIGGGEVSLGDLADLTVTNDNDLSCDVSSWGAPPPRVLTGRPASCLLSLSSDWVPCLRSAPLWEDAVRSFGSLPWFTRSCGHGQGCRA